MIAFTLPEETALHNVEMRQKVNTFIARLDVAMNKNPQIHGTKS